MSGDGPSVVRLSRAPSRWVRALERPSSAFATVAVVVVGWLLFLSLDWWTGGPTVRDDHVTLYSAWMLAHGSFGCAYQVPRPSIDYPLTAPLFTVLDALLQVLTRVGVSHPFPYRAIALAGCRHDYGALNGWLRGTPIAHQSLWLGFVVWPVLVLGALSVVRTARKGPTRLEWWLIAVMSVLPVYQLPFQEYYHPEDVLALAALLGSLSGVVRGRYRWAGALAVVSMLSQQNALLALLVVLIMIPDWRALREFAVSGTVTFLCLVTPLTWLSGWTVLRVSLFGTGLNDNPVYSTWMGELGIYGTHALVISRGGPVLLSVLGALWWFQRRGRPSLDHALSLMALAFAIRLGLEENLWSYYSIGLVTCWLVGDLLTGRVRLGPWVWSFAVSYLAWEYYPGGPGWSALTTLPLWVWQLVLLPSAVWLSVRPLLQRPESTLRTRPLVDHGAAP
ncbi:MAG: hypothetical protein HKL87_06605 [Acidimicrobiaceae bacterium]|nr:hypothetical protein [Acidimicrobiaceae bacterium]